MIKIIMLVFVSTLALSYSGVTKVAFATCTGSKNCRACKNCKYCKHCAKEGGKCGVCSR